MQAGKQKGSNAYVPTKADTQQSFHYYCIEEWLGESTSESLRYYESRRSAPGHPANYWH